MPFTFLLSFLTGSKLKFALIALVVVAFLGTGTWGYLTIKHLQKENAQILLQAQNKALQDKLAQQAAIMAQQQADEKDYETRTEQIVANLQALNAKLAASLAAKQQTYNSLVDRPAPSAPGGHVDTQQVEDHVNSGMSQFFTDLQNESGGTHASK